MQYQFHPFLTVPIASPLLFAFRNIGMSVNTHCHEENRDAFLQD